MQHLIILTSWNLKKVEILRDLDVIRAQLSGCCFKMTYIYNGTEQTMPLTAIVMIRDFTAWKVTYSSSVLSTNPVTFWDSLEFNSEYWFISCVRFHFLDLQMSIMLSFWIGMIGWVMTKATMWNIFIVAFLTFVYYYLIMSILFTEDSNIN